MVAAGVAVGVGAADGAPDGKLDGGPRGDLDGDLPGDQDGDGAVAGVGADHASSWRRDFTGADALSAVLSVVRGGRAGFS